MKKQNNYAEKYSKVNNWQYSRGEILLDLIEHKNNETVLDLGCGTGELTFKLASQIFPFKGKLIALDPDSDRLKLAKNNQPNTISNITYINGFAEKLEKIKSNSIDIVFSNYVIHWIKNKKNMLSELYRCLVPNGSCIFEFIASPPLFLENITLLKGEEGKHLLDRIYNSLKKNEWVELLTLSKFKIEHMDFPIIDYNFDSLSHFFDWWEGTTHGAFLRTDIPNNLMKELHKTYKNKIVFKGTSLQLVIRK